MANQLYARIARPDHSASYSVRMPLTIEIWSDVVCPWCYIGKRRFEAALERFEHRDEVSVLWRSFELDPDAPVDPEGTAAERLAAKYGMTVERAAAMHAADDRAGRAGRARVPPRPAPAAATRSPRTGSSTRRPCTATRRPRRSG